MQTSAKLGILAFVFSLHSCGPPAEEIVETAGSNIAEVESTAAVALQETQLATDIPSQPGTDTQTLGPTPTLSPLTSTTAICENLGTHTYCVAEGAPVVEGAPDLWGHLIPYSPEFFCASDLDIRVCRDATTTLLLAIQEWGNYGPIEYWIQGVDQASTEAMIEVFCDRRLHRNGQDLSSCKDKENSKEYGMQFFRQVGAERLAAGQPGSEAGGLGGYQHNYHKFGSSVPFGFDRSYEFDCCTSAFDDQKVIFHEYYHAVQQSSIIEKDHHKREAKQTARWFNEGSAEFYAQLATSRLRASGTLTYSDIGVEAEHGYDFRENMRGMLDGAKDAYQDCGGSLPETGHGDKCGSYDGAYSGGAWAHAYLAHKHGEDVLMGTFYPNLEAMGFEATFIHTYGQNLMDFYTEFDEFLNLPLEEQLAILPTQDDTAQTLEAATEEEVTALHNWGFSYDFTANSIELSSQYAPETKNIQSLSVIFTPTIKNIPPSVVKNEGYFDGVFKQTLGFSMHEYSTNRLDVSLTDHVIEIPRAKTGFKMDMNITIAAESTGGETDTFELADAFTRPDDYYPSPILSVPESLNIDLSRYDYYEIPSPNAQAVMLATIGGTGDGVWHEQPARKPTMPLRIGLFGKVYAEDYETVRDLLEVLAIVAPSLDIGFATDLNQVTFPIHLVDCTEQLQQAWTNCRVDGPRGEYVSVEYHDQDYYQYDMFDNAWGYLYISRQRVNRHTLTHEMAHAFGLRHWNIENCSMGPGYAQSSNWTAFELMTLAAIYDSSTVTNGQTRDDMRAALSIPIDTTWNDFVNNPDLLSTTPGDIWVQFGRELTIQADEAIKSSAQSLETE